MIEKIEDSGMFWNSNDIEMVKLCGEWYCLDGWNGETYGECWKYKDSKGLDRADNETYRLKPVYKEIAEDEYELIGYTFEY